MVRLRELLRRLRLRSDQLDAAGQRRVDATASAVTRGPEIEQQGEMPGTVPPNYIKTYDEGRPRH